MTKTRTLLLISTTLVVGLFLAACAGAPTSLFETGSQVVTGGPAIQAWQAITSAEAVSGEAAPADSAGLWAGVHKSSLAHQAMEQVTQSLLHYGDCPFGGD